MSLLVDRLRSLHAEGHEVEMPGLRTDDSRFAPGEARDAAVLAGIVDRPRPTFLLTHRPSNMRAHPGQVAFPGGKIDAGESPVEAALREAWEELAIPPDAVTVIGESDVYRTGTGYIITPILALLPPDLVIVPNPSEVAQWFEVPVDFVFDAANHVVQSAMWNGMRREYLDIQWHEHRIWGVTAAIIANLSRRLDWARVADA
jgi:8-oxo-dGTP pyrophosphatase MutT (NUDIX family)